MFAPIRTTIAPRTRAVNRPERLEGSAYAGVGFTASNSFWVLLDLFIIDEPTGISRYRECTSENERLSQNSRNRIQPIYVLEPLRKNRGLFGFAVHQENLVNSLGGRTYPFHQIVLIAVAA